MRLVFSWLRVLYGADGTGRHVSMGNVSEVDVKFFVLPRRTVSPHGARRLCSLVVDAAEFPFVNVNLLFL